MASRVKTMRTGYKEREGGRSVQSPVRACSRMVSVADVTSGMILYCMLAGRARTVTGGNQVSLPEPCLSYDGVFRVRGLAGTGEIKPACTPYQGSVEKSTKVAKRNCRAGPFFSSFCAPFNLTL